MSSRWSKVVLAAVVATFAAVAIVHAQSGGGVIRACVTNQSGQLTILSDYTGYTNTPAPSCTGGAHAIEWNQQGPTGPTGATGPQGASGGSSGTQHHFVAVADSGARKVTNHTEQFLVHASCPDGQSATGGGYSRYGTAALVGQDYVFADQPLYRPGDAIPTGWLIDVVVSATGPGTAGVRAYAVCTGDQPASTKPLPKPPNAKITTKLALSPKLSSRRVIRVP